MTHDELQNSLAEHLLGSTDRMVWTNTQIGPAGSPRPDVFTVAKSFARFAADAYEIKVSLSDLRRDTTSGKWTSYRKFAHRVWFAFERGLAPLSEIPRDCGVIVRGDGGAWRAARKPISQVLDTLPRDAWLKLLMDFGSQYRAEPRLRTMDGWRAQQIVRRQWGDKLAELLHSRIKADGAYAYQTQCQAELATELAQEIEARRASARKQAERNEAAMTAALQHLAQALHLPADATPYDLREALHKLANLMRGHNLDRAVHELLALRGLLLGAPAEETT